MNDKTDIWALGCVLLDLALEMNQMCNNNLIKEKNEIKNFRLFDRLYDQNCVILSRSVNVLLYNLLKKMLVMDPKQRPNAKELLQDSFVNCDDTYVHATRKVGYQLLQLRQKKCLHTPFGPRLHRFDSGAFGFGKHIYRHSNRWSGRIQRQSKDNINDSKVKIAIKKDDKSGNEREEMDKKAQANVVKIDKDIDENDNKMDEYDLCSDILMQEISWEKWSGSKSIKLSEKKKKKKKKKKDRMSIDDVLEAFGL